MRVFFSQAGNQRVSNKGTKAPRRLHTRILWQVRRRLRLTAGLYPTHRKVDFIVCGAQKAGTSALASYLDEHPEICMADAKELHFFDNEEIFQKKSPDYRFYHCAFSPGACHRLLGEATPIYMYWYTAPRRMWEYNPDLKLIVILRNPITRAYSHWNMQRTRGMETLSFWEAIQEERKRCRQALPYQHRLYSYVDRGFYSEQLRRLWTYFPLEQVFVIKTEDLRKNPKECMEKLWRFLGLDDPGRIIFPKDVHSRPYVSPLGEREKDYLLRVYEYEIKNLERLLGWDCSEWLNPEREIPF
ncbi:MAG: sulfotransferase domain-containing protein [bacterium]